MLFPVAFYVKGEIEPATLFRTEVVLNQEEIQVHLADTAVVGTAASEDLMGVGSNGFTGSAVSDLFVMCCDTSVSEIYHTGTVLDFEAAAAKFGFIGNDAPVDFAPEAPAVFLKFTQGVSGNDLTLSPRGELMAVLKCEDLRMAPRSSRRKTAVASFDPSSQTK